MNMTPQLPKPIASALREGNKLLALKDLLDKNEKFRALVESAKLEAAKSPEMIEAFERELALRGIGILSMIPPELLRQIILLRLRGNGGRVYTFLDGTSFTGEAAAAEVERGSAYGAYFIEFETRAMRIIADYLLARLESL